MINLLKRIFKVEHIHSPDGTPYLERIVLFRVGSRDGWAMGLYLHDFLAPDRAHLHNHPRTFISIGLSGMYYEYIPGYLETLWKAPFIRVIPAGLFHRVDWVSPKSKFKPRPCRTLVLTYGHSEEWGFLVNGEFMPSEEYAQEFGRDVIVKTPPFMKP